MEKNYFTHLTCSVCDEPHKADSVQTVCRSCGKSLLARYDLASARRELSRESWERDVRGFWDYAALLPVNVSEGILSLGERTTPLIPLRKWGASLRLEHLLLKEEGQLPTGSFKARGLALAVTRARKLGLKHLCIPSAGNAGGALAAYAAAAGLHCHIFMPRETPFINIMECRAYDAQIELVDGTISDAARRMNERRKDHPDWFDVSTLKEPYRLEGKKTMGFEVAQQCGWKLPDAIVYPTGGGTGLIGMWKAFNELEQLGWLGPERPKLISVQSSGCAPIVKAFREKRKESEFWENAQTIASGLRVPRAFADHLILRAIAETGGAAVDVSDDAIRTTVLEAAAQEGLFLCPEGAATLAALPRLLEEGVLRTSDRIVVFNTASGLKYPEVLESAAPA